MAPAVHAALKESVRRDPSALTNAIFPVMGPAVRKAVSESLRRILQTFTHALDNSFSWRGVKWRLESWRTGRPFAEVVLCHTLIYRVEQVFMIYRPTGLLLSHVTAPEVETRDPDLVSGMLTAIRDFVGDSFSSGSSSELNTIEVGDLHLWIEGGPHALLALAIRGQAPSELREALQGLVEKVHCDAGAALESFQGETRHFETLRPILEGSLQARFRGAPQRIVSWKLIIVLALVLGLMGWALVSGKRARDRREGLLSKLAAEPGVVVISTSVRGGRLSVNGLRDPLAGDPWKLAASSGFTAQDLEFHWEPYVALTPEMILSRAKQRLDPPAGVGLEWNEGKLVVDGVASSQWLSEAREKALRLPGVEEVDTSGVKPVKTEIQLSDLEQELSGLMIPFDMAQSSARAAEEVLARVTVIAEQVAEWKTRMAETPSVRDVKLRVTGHTDRLGTETFNVRLGQERAEWVKKQLVDRGVTSEMIEVTSAGARFPISATNPDAAANRRVTFSLQ